MLSISPLTAHVGAEISGINLAGDTSDDAIAKVNAALAERGVVAIRDQHLSIEQFMAFSRRLGPLAIHSLNQFSRPGMPELMVNSNIIENGKPIGLADAGRDWHTDSAYTERPYRSTVLYSVEIPVRNGVALGDTIFASTSASYDSLDDAMKQRLVGLRAVHAHGVAREKRGRGLALEENQHKEIHKGVEHPVVRTHPTTGRKCLYVDEGTTARIVGMDEAASEALVGQLLEHVLQPQYLYRHNWRVGDILMWDNCSVLHCALGDYLPTERRLIYRTLIQGTVPV